MTCVPCDQFIILLSGGIVSSAVLMSISLSLSVGKGLTCTVGPPLASGIDGMLAHLTLHFILAIFTARIVPITAMGGGAKEKEKEREREREETDGQPRQHHNQEAVLHF